MRAKRARKFYRFGRVSLCFNQVFWFSSSRLKPRFTNSRWKNLIFTFTLISQFTYSRAEKVQFTYSRQKKGSFTCHVSPWGSPIERKSNLLGGNSPGEIHQGGNCPDTEIKTLAVFARTILQEQQETQKCG